MGITTIPNQPIRFKNTAIPDECFCMGQEFAQLINKDDQTQFQIKSSNQVVNGDFTDNLNDWVVYLGITGTVALINESDTGACDGSGTITVSGGTPGYTYSIDGVTFQASNLFENLCNGHYTVIIKDSTGKQGSVEFDIVTNVVCGTIGCLEYDYLTYDEAVLLNCLEYDTLCKYPGVIADEDLIRIMGQSVASLFPTGKIIAVLDGPYIGLYTVAVSNQTVGNTNITLTDNPFSILDVGDTFELAR